MGMRDYAVDDYGMVLTEDLVKVIAQKVFSEEYTEEDMYHWGYELYEKGICEYISEFTGEAQPIDDNGKFYWGGDCKVYSDEWIIYVPLNKYPTLLKAAYNSVDEIVPELKEKLGQYLPEDFDYKNNIYHISGIYFG